MTTKIRITFTLALGCFMLMTSLSASRPDHSQESTGAPLAVTGTLIDGTGAGPVPDAVVVINDGLITAVGSRQEIKIPGNARVYQFPGGTMLPGFINAHVHSKYDEKLLQTWAREGVTTVRDLAEAIGVPWFALRDELRKDPKNARVVAAGPVLSAPDGFIKEVSLVVTSAEDAQAKVKGLIDEGADVIKVGLCSPIYPELSPDVVKAIVTAAHSRGRPVAAHVVSAHGMAVAVEAGVDDINHLAPIGDKSEALVRQTKETGIYWIPTLEPQLAPPPGKAKPPAPAGPPGKPAPPGKTAPPGATTPRERALASFKLFLSLGGAVALGNDSGSMPGVQVGMPIKEILMMREAGMTPMQIIEASTRHAARVCRLEKELGTLQPGKRADLFVVDGNPLENLQALTRTRLVVHDGVIIREERL